MQTPSGAADSLYECHEPAIERTVVAVCRRYRIRPPDSDDFGQELRLHLLKDGERVLRRFAAQSSIETYLFAVAKRVFINWRHSQHGRWRPSARSCQAGPLAVRLETLVARDGVSASEALEMVARPACAGLEQLIAIMQRHRPRQFVPLDALSAHTPLGTTDAAVAASTAQSVQTALRLALSELPDPDKRLLRMRFGEGLDGTRIGRFLGVPRRRVYTQLRYVLIKLRRSLDAAGIGLVDVRVALASALLNLPELDVESETRPRGRQSAVPACGCEGSAERVA